MEYEYRAAVRRMGESDWKHIGSKATKKSIAPCKGLITNHKSWTSRHGALFEYQIQRRPVIDWEPLP